MTTNNTWEEAYEALQTQDHKEVLDTEFESGKYYEIDWMIKYFTEKGEIEKVTFLEELESKIEAEEGRKITVGDKFFNERVVLEVLEIDEEKYIMGDETRPLADLELSYEELKTLKRYR